MQNGISTNAVAQAVPARLLTLYFSGTGNSEFIAAQFSQRMGAACHSIEEDIDFKKQMAAAETLVLCYPIYGSCVPRIMREFITANRLSFDGKNLMILSTQLMFSGDGARVCTDLLEGITLTILYAEHFNMPNNICNLSLFPLADAKKLARYRSKAQRKLNRVCRDIDNGIIKKRGFNPVSKYLGLVTQRCYFPELEKKAQNDVQITAACIACGKCVKICPMKNLEMSDHHVAQKGQCTLCYRCVNQCPQKAITVLLHGDVRKQYQGITHLAETAEE